MRSGTVSLRKDTRWCKGSSGNKAGRPRGARGHKKILAKVANEIRAYKEGARSKQGSTIELVFLAIRNAAANGNHRALALYEKSLGRGEPADVPLVKGTIILPEKLTEEEWLERYSPNYRRPNEDVL